MNTLLDLVNYCKSQARIESRDYFQRGYERPDEVDAWRHDCSRRDSQRKACFRAFPARLATATYEPLKPGNYGRLSISADGSIDYTACQYPALEVYPALLNYLEATN
jgi:hypothetical protein